MHEEEYALHDDMEDVIAFKVVGDSDAMCHHQALRAPDRRQFVGVMIEEVKDHVQRKHWELTPMNQVPKGTKVLAPV